MTVATQIVEYSGHAYAPLLSTLPFITTGIFETTKFRLIQGIVAADLAASSGAGTVGHGATLNYAVGTIGAILNDVATNVKMFPWLAKLDGVTDDTAAIRAAMAVCQHVFIPTGTGVLSDHLPMRDNQTVTLSPGARLVQTAANRNIFQAVLKNNAWIHCNGAELYGKGNWTSDWTGVGGHDDRAIEFLGCTNSGVTRPNVKNCGLAGISIYGGNNVRVVMPTIEGTHTHGAPLPFQGNFQFGVFVRHDPTYGPARNIRIDLADISGVTQGVLIEHEVGVVLTHDSTVLLTSPNIHDIPGQHAFYITSGGVTISSPVCTNIALSAVKVQSGTANEDIKDVTVDGLIAKNLGSNMFEIATTGTGRVSGVRGTGTGRHIGRGVSLLNAVQDSDFDVTVTDVTDYATQINGVGVKDVKVKVNGRHIGRDGVLVTATASSGLKIWPMLRECNTSVTAGACGIRVESASAEVELFDPDVTDANNNMDYGLFNSVAGSIVKVRGSAKFTGAKYNAVRATGTISEWPTETTLSGLTGQFVQNGNVKSSQPIVFQETSTSAANVVIWNQNLPDESACMFRAEIVGKLSGSSERKAVVSTVLVYRDNGGAAVMQGSADEDVAIASAAFTGAYSWIVSGNQVLLLANSGAAANCDWTARITANPI